VERGLAASMNLDLILFLVPVCLFSAFLLSCICYVKIKQRLQCAQDDVAERSPTVFQLYVRKPPQQPGTLETGNGLDVRRSEDSSVLPADEWSRDAGTLPMLARGAG